MNKIIFESNQGFASQEIEVDEHDRVFVVRDGQRYQIHFDCLDALGVSTDHDTYLAKAVGDENYALICNYPEELKRLHSD